ncbi:MAG: hypothetical protein JRD89_21025 [Deltaproteobacteria bacterium]|nr:hypothetical protein [Deltaproteobacteria bacterium]
MSDNDQSRCRLALWDAIDKFHKLGMYDRVHENYQTYIRMRGYLTLDELLKSGKEIGK